MRIDRIDTHSTFEKHYKRLSKGVKETAKAKESIFRNNPFQAMLDTHKLHGKDRGAWAFSVNQKYRIKFIFLADNSVLFLDIGTHDIYR